MAHLRCDFYSDALALSTSMTVLLPQPTTTQIGMTGQAGSEPPPVLYLLHGLSDDDTTWLRRTSVERYVSELGWAVVMPQVHRSFYADEHLGGAFWTFVSDELPALVHRFFRVSSARADTFVAGLSMGGYGAFKLALRQPHRFAAAASLSGVLDLGALVRSGDLPPSPDHRMLTRILGPDRVLAPEDDLLALARRADPATLPALHLSCGTEDVLLDGNRAFEATCAEAAVPLTTAYRPGEHEWGLWDAGLVDVLTFFDQVRRTAAQQEVAA
ncbi:MAG: Putative esterase [uncultured Friedmanniella sp.]|uniref:Esterase n=1 Tax=uncultured Friedmanniella sp. TaxID=335381 RepID=A0A6J4L6X3_9ACTN|nr:MAG: Putative esterase [uncultured Friedmanniella sp.]